MAWRRLTTPWDAIRVHLSRSQCPKARRQMGARALKIGAVLETPLDPGDGLPMARVPSTVWLPQYLRASALAAPRRPL
jgi:hypothetical protein